MKLLLVLSCLIASVAEARSLNEIQKSKEFRVCFSDSPGIVETSDKACKENCTWSGPAYDVLKIFADSLKGVTMKTYNLDWDEQFKDKDGKIRKGEVYTPQLFSSGKCDVYPSNLTKNEWRDKLIDFTIVFPSRMMIIVRTADKKNFKGPDNLLGKKAVIKAQTSFHSWIDEQNTSGLFKKTPVIFEFITDNSEYDKLMSGVGDFGLIDTDAGLNLTRTTHKKLYPTFLVGSIDQIGWGFAKADSSLVKAANTFLDAQRKDNNSEVNQIWKKYYGKNLAEFTQFVMSFK